MKKILSIFILFICTTLLCAQSSEYNRLFSLAQQYESESNWTYAMGYYFDSIIEDPYNSRAAYDRLQEILNSIKKGNPGLQEFEGQDHYDAWIKLLTDTEKYWSEYCPYTVEFGPLSLMESKNNFSSYSTRIHFSHSLKYEIIMNAILAAYSQIRYDYSDLPENWPFASITGQLFSESQSLESENNDSQEYFINSVALSYFEGSYPPYFTNAFADFVLFEYSVTLSSKDKIISSPVNFILHDGNSYSDGTKDFEIVFKNIPARLSKQIDEHSIVPEIDSVKMHFGYQTFADTNIFADEYLEKQMESTITLPCFEIPSDKYSLSDLQFAYNFHEGILNNKKITKGEDYEGYIERISYFSGKDYFNAPYIPAWIIANYYSIKYNHPLCYDKYGNQIDDRGFLVCQDEYGECLKRTIKFTGRQKEEKLNALIRVASRELEKEEKTLCYIQYTYPDNQNEFLRMQNIFTDLKNAIDEQEVLLIKDKLQLLKNEFSINGANYNYSTILNKYRLITKKAEHAKQLYPQLLSKYNFLYQELQNDETSSAKLSSLLEQLQSYENSFNTIVESAVTDDNLALIDFSDLENKLKNYKNAIQSTDLTVDEIVLLSEQLIQKSADNNISLPELEYSLAENQNIISNYKTVVQNKQYHLLNSAINSINQINLDPIYELLESNISQKNSQNKKEELQQRIYEKTEYLLNQSQIFLSAIPDNEGNNIIQNEYDKILTTLYSIKNAEYFSNEELQETLEVLEKFNFDKVIILINQYNDGLKLLKLIGLYLIPDSQSSSEEFIACNIITEKNSIAAKEKIKGTVKFSNDFSYTDFILEVAKHSGQEFSITTTKKSYTIILPELE